MTGHEFQVRWHEGGQTKSKRYSNPDGAASMAAALVSEPWASLVEVRVREVQPWQPIAVRLAVSS